MANRVDTFSGSTNGTTTTWTELGGGGGLTAVECSSPYPIMTNEPFTLSKVKPGDKLMLTFYIGPGIDNVVQQGQYVLWCDIPTVGQSTLLLNIQQFVPGASQVMDESLNIENLRANADGYEFQLDMAGQVGVSLVELHSVYKLP